MDIRRRAQEFKVAALRAVRLLFPSEHNPFYSGFGHRQADLLAYRKVGVPAGKIFIMDGKTDEFTNLNQTYRKSCDSLAEMVDAMFPPTAAGAVSPSTSGSAAAAADGRRPDDERFNTLNYWRLPTPLIDPADLLGADGDGGDGQDA